MKTTTFAFTVSFFSLASLLLSQAHSQTITRLDPPVAGSSNGYAISPDGNHVAGNATTSGGSRAYLWSFSSSWGTGTNLGTLGGASVAYGVTDNANTIGKIVGQTSVTGSGCTQGFSYSGGTMTSIGAITIGALAISNDGAYNVGYANAITPPTSSPCIGPFRGFRNGVLLLPVSSLGNGVAYAYGINNDGIAVGWSNIAPVGDQVTGSPHATIWAKNMTGGSDMGTLPGGSNSFAYAINSSGRAVGQSDKTGGVIRAFYKDLAGSPQELPPLSGETTSWAYAINNNGDVAGYSQSSTGTRHAVWWKSTGPNTYSGAILLFTEPIVPTIGWTRLLEGRGISDRNAATAKIRITGTGTYAFTAMSGQTRAFVWEAPY